MNFVQFIKNRKNILIIFAAALSFILIGKLVSLQIVQGEYYTQISDKRMFKTTTVKAQRGEIVDRYGRALVNNKAAFSVMINDQFDDAKQMNDTLTILLKIAEENGKIYEDGLPVSYQAPYQYRFEEVPGLENGEQKWKKKLEVAEDSSAADIVSKLTTDYEIDPNMEETAKRKLIGLRYDMAQRNFGSRNPFLFMSDIDIGLVSKIKENPNQLKGVEVISEPVRSYPQNGIAAHMLGQVGIIYNDEYQELKDKGYGMNDTLGKDGLEKYLEQYLRGKDGKESMEFNINGENVVLSQNEAAKPGNRALLTIDANVQETGEKALAEAVKNMRAQGATDIEGAAAVAIEVNTGEVLAIANYPTYDPATFKEQYSELLADPKKPMFNRAISGAYPPGSTFKPVTAVAGLQEGAVTGKDLIDCNGPYEVYAPSYRPACWIYNDYGGKHGYIDIVKALEVSCNIYFFETGRRLGIEKLNHYGKQFGLGQLTGIELSGETSGVLAGPEEREAQGGIWYPGDTIAAAIGQSDNLFTPIQMANYAATVANGGTRYAPHLVKDIVEYDGSKTVVSFEPKVLNKIDITPQNLDLVHQGMRRVIETTSKESFQGAKYQAAGKTGTAQVRKDKTPHSWFISFAPYDQPQVAIAVVVEYGGINGIGKYVSEVARKMYDAYFYSDEVQEPVTSNTLLR